MPSKDPGQRLDDILDNILAIGSFTTGFGLEQFLADRKTRYAVTRAIEIISEASRRLPDDIKARHIEVDWPQLAALGNVCRHEYDMIDHELLWTTLTRRLPVLERAVREELRTIDQAYAGSPGKPPGLVDAATAPAPATRSSSI